MSERSVGELSYRSAPLKEVANERWQNWGELGHYGAILAWIGYAPCEVQLGIPIMSALPKAPPATPCPFCGVTDGVPHETQEGCIAALHVEIGRVRGILAHLRPTGSLPVDEPENQPAATVRLTLD